MSTTNTNSTLTPFVGAAGGPKTGNAIANEPLALSPDAQLRRAAAKRMSPDEASRAEINPLVYVPPTAALTEGGFSRNGLLHAHNPAGPVDPFGVEIDPTTMTAELEQNWDAIMNTLDPGGLIDKFRNGELKPEHLKGEAGQLVMMKLKDRLAQVQSFMDAVRGILDAYNDAMKRTAQNIRA